MKPPSCNSARPLRAHPLRFSAICALAIVIAGSAHAQSVLAPSAPVRTPAKPSRNGNGPSLASISSALGSGAPLIQRGPIAIRPHLQYRFTYGDGIEAGPGNQRETTIQAVTPGVLVDVGKHWNFDYTPTWTFYSNEVFRDTFGQTASLSGRYAFDDWTLGGMQSYESTYSTLIETGRQTHQEKYASSIFGAYKLGRRTSLDVSVSRSARYANAVTEAPEWTTSDWLQYSSTDWLRYYISPQLNVAIGITFGFADVSVGDDMKFNQPQAQITWQPTEKLSFSAQGGIESRTFESGNQNALDTPVYSASFGYQPVETTKLSLTASHSVSASYFANEITKGRGWSVGVEQRFVRRLYLDVSLSGNNSRYLATRALDTARRDDRYIAWNARLSTVFFGRTAVGLFYQTGRNSSDVETYEFTSNQIGFEASHRF